MSKASKNTGKDDPGRLFAEQLIERMKEINASDWKQGWIDAKSNGGIPQNIDGFGFSVPTGNGSSITDRRTVDGGIGH
mgnify:CR=1 FL=1